MLTPETTGTAVTEPHYSVVKVAELLDVGRDFVYDRIKSGEFRAIVELGTSRPKQRIPASVLNEWLAERTILRNSVEIEKLP